MGIRVSGYLGIGKSRATKFPNLSVPWSPDLLIFRSPEHGFTLIEVMLGASIIAVVAVALIGGFLGESYLNMNARNMMAAMNDATRVMEQMRVQNIGCQIPSAVPPRDPLTNQPYFTWNAWLNAQTPAKTIDNPNANVNEQIVVICQDQDGGTAWTDYCGWIALGPNPAQIGLGEWRDFTNDISGAISRLPSLDSGRGRQGGNTTFDPIRVTVSVGWSQRSRTVGGAGSGAEFTSVGSGKNSTKVAPGPDANNNGVIDSQAMLTTLVTCR